MNLTLWWIKPLAIFALVASLIGGFAMFVSHERELGKVAGQAELKRGYDAGVAKAAKEAKELADKFQTAVEKSHAEDLARAEVRIADGLAARTELDRLRARLRNPGPAVAGSAPQAGPVADAPATVYGLLEACSVRYEAVAGDAGRLAGQVIGLQGYVLSVTGMGGNSLAAERAPAGFIGLVTQTATGPSDSIRSEVVPP